MKYELKDFQEKAVVTLAKQMVQADDMYHNYNDKVSCSLSAVTGSGKTVMAAAAIEALLNGSEDLTIEPHQNAVILWVTDSPALNDQTFNKFQLSSDMNVLMMHIIENTTTEEIRELQPHNIYFLNRQKLSDSSLLTRGGEIPTFWQILQNTYDRGTTVYMMLDEAHRGLGSTSSEEKEQENRQTIYSKLIDGFTEGNFTLEPMPIVVGISATIKRFEEAMKNRKKRTVLPEVSVSPAEVQASGLLKDTIVISVPSDDDAAQGVYLTSACRTLQESTKQWKLWCQANQVPEVHPLMVIQVRDNVKEAELRQLCIEISEKIPWIDQHKSFANVFGEQMSYSIGGIDIPYIQPELVQDRSEIVVLFAKEAISTGWDCPRAEVIYSLRSHSDDTYIAQLIGRMVRTPLAKRVDLDTLNSVTCYLPYFDRNTVQKVVDHLTKDKDDDSAVSSEDGRKVLIHPVEVEWDSSLQVDNAFESIKTRKRSSKQHNFIRGALELSGLLMKYEIDLDAENHTMKVLMRELNESINTFYHHEYEHEVEAISKVESTDIRIQNMDAAKIDTEKHTENADVYAIDQARKKADHVFEPTLTNRFFRQEAKRGLDSMTINTRLAAAGNVEGIVNHVTNRAKDLISEFQEKYRDQINKLSESPRQEIEAKLLKNGIASDISLTRPLKDIYDGDASHKYSKHVLNNPEDHLAPIQLYSIEDDVVNEELKHGAIAWYRNPGNGNNHTLSIMYNTSEGLKLFHPDFIFFERVDGKVMPYIVDPHGAYLSDSIGKLRGYVAYVRKFGDTFSRIWSLDGKDDGPKRYLDLKDQATQEAIMDFNGLDVAELYKGPYSHKYEY